jgi:translation initiation factor 2 alpha subunit (eIF-2alpha)
MRFYNNKYPKVDDIVICQVTKINNSEGVRVKLLEYDNIEGLISLNEISRKRRFTIKRIVVENKTYPFLVINIDEKNGYIDLSNKYIIEKDRALEKYTKYQVVMRIFNRYIGLLKQRLPEYKSIDIDMIGEKFGPLTIWGECPRDDLYKLMFQIKKDNHLVADKFELTTVEQDIFLESLNKFIPEIVFKLSYKLSIQSHAYDSLSIIKKNITQALEDFTKVITLDKDTADNVPEITLINSPEYLITLKSTNEKQTVDLMKSFIKTIKSKFDNKFKVIDMEFIIRNSFSDSVVNVKTDVDEDDYVFVDGVFLNKFQHMEYEKHMCTKAMHDAGITGQSRLLIAEFNN